MKCPECGSTNVTNIMLEDGPARECGDCDHWGYLRDIPLIESWDEMKEELAEVWAFCKFLLGVFIPNVGTRSVLWGYHAVWLHGWFVVAGWHRLHGWNSVEIGRNDFTGQRVYTSLHDYRLWMACFLHDLGYLGKPNMDGPEGELHPLWAAQFMHNHFGWPWGDFCRYHSRFLARADKTDPSKLCAADKLAIALYPTWLFALLVTWTGEVFEYLKHHRDPNASIWAWALQVQETARKAAAAMKDGGPDTFTGTADDNAVRRG